MDTRGKNMEEEDSSVLKSKKSWQGSRANLVYEHWGRNNKPFPGKSRREREKMGKRERE